MHLGHAQLLQPMEDLFYSKLYQACQAKSQSTPQAQLQQSQPVVAPGMSAQFLDAVAKAPNVSLTDQQRRMLEDARRQSQSGCLPPQPLHQSTLAPAPPATPSQVATSASAAAQVAALKTNPGLINQFIKNREEHMRTRIRERELWLARCPPLTSF